MPHTRRQPRVAPTGRVTVRLSTEQRNLFIESAETPKDLGHALHRAPVREGKLTVRVDRAELDALIAAAANIDTSDRREERALQSLLRYLESLEDRFEDPPGEEEAAGEQVDEQRLDRDPRMSG